MKSSIFCLFLTIFVVRGDNTPVLIWSPSRSMSDMPQSYIGHNVDTNRFHDNYLTPLSLDQKTNLIVFSQDKLSIEDFTNHADVYNPNSNGGAFKNVKSAMDEEFSVQLPSVASPMAGIEKLKKSYKGRVVTIDNPEDLANTELVEGKSYLILVALHPVSGKDAAKALEENDKMIGRCVHHLNKRGVKYSAIYTAHSAPKNEVQEEFKGRHLLASEEKLNDSMVFEYDENVMMSLKYADLIVIMPNSEVPEKPFKLNSDASRFIASEHLNMTTDFGVRNGTVDNSSYIVNIDMSNSQGKLTMTFNLSLNYANEWQSGIGNLTYVGNTSNTTDFNFEDIAMDYKILAAAGFSFHCSRLQPRAVKRYFNTTVFQTISLSLTGFQIEAFNGNTTEIFSDFVWDCVEFFTVPIWMGIFSTIILLLILSFGLTMLASITTMDRFDDPKGKQMTITLNE